MERNLLASVICAVLIANSVSSINYHNEGVKTKSFHVDPQLADMLPRRPVEMHHQYSRVVSNRPTSGYTTQLSDGSDATRNYQGSNAVYQSNRGNIDTTRQGRTPYGFAVENQISTYLTECPPNATGQFAYLYDCRRFLNCWKGRGFIQSCGPGTVFNPDTLECDSPKKVECNHGASKYESSSGGPAQYIYNKPISQTVYTSELKTGDIKCSPGFNGMEPHPYDCSKFLNCGNGATYIQDCGPGTYFNPASKVCDIASNVECKRGARLVYQLPSAPREIVSTGAGNGAVKCSPGAAGVEMHPYDCRKFLNCANGITHIQNCGVGTVFNAATKVCDFPYKVDCGSRSIVGDSRTSSSTTHEVRRPIGATQANLNQTVYQSQTYGGNHQYANRGTYGHRHGHHHTHQHTADCQHHHRDIIHENTPERQYYNWTTTRTEQAIPNRQYNWTRTISTPSLGTQQYNWTSTTNTGRWTESSNPFSRYPENTPSTNYNGPLQSTTNLHQSTNNNWPHQHHVHTPQPVTSPANGEWSNPSTVHQSVSVSTNGRPPQTTETRRVQYWLPQYPPPIYSNSPNPQSNFGIQQNPDRNSFSQNVTFYYAQPVQDSDKGVVVQQTNPPFSEDNFESSYPKTPTEKSIDSVSSSSVNRNIVYPIKRVPTSESHNGKGSPVSTPPNNLRPSTSYPSPNLPPPSSETNIVYHITSETRSQTLNPNNSFVPVMSTHLLVPFPATTQLKPQAKPEIPGDVDNRPRTNPSRDYDSNLYGGLLPPHPGTPLEYIPPVYMLPSHPPLATEGDSVPSPSEPNTSVQSKRIEATLGQTADSSHRFLHREWTASESKPGIPPQNPSTLDVQRTTIITQSKPITSSTTQRTVDTDSSVFTNIYYAVPVEDSDELFEDIYGGDISPNPEIRGNNNKKTVDKPESSRNPEDTLPSRSNKINVTSIFTSRDSPLPNTQKQTESVEFTPGTTKTNVRMFSIYPSVQNATFEEIARSFALNPPMYSPSYSSITHSRNLSAQPNPELEVISPINAWVHATNRSIVAHPINVTVTKVVSTQFDESNLPTFKTTVVDYPPEVKVIPLKRPPSTEPTFTHTFNREYYKHPVESSNSNSNPVEMSNIPISEAIKALLKPYLNRSGTVSEDDVKKADTFIMSLAKPMQDPIKPEKDKPKVPGANDKELKTVEPKVHDKEVELILAGEQDNLSEGVWRKHHKHFHPHGHGHSNPEFHNREFHQNHPHIRNPFANAPSGTPSLPPDTETLPAPDLQGSATSFQTTTPTYYPDNNFDGDYGQAPIPVDQRPTEESHNEDDFDCGNGKFVKKFEVCDGVNHCGNRVDEQFCDHLGYQVRLSNENGSRHMGRVEVKVLGKWGYVCDDKFGMRDADVLCRELGFPLGASEVRANSYYAPHVEMMTPNGDVLFVMDEIDCRGNETSIKECDFKGWGVHDCTADEVVGVVCKLPVMKCSNDYWLCTSSKECIPPAFVCDNVADCTDGSDESELICNSQIEYRLADGNSKIEGRVEVKYHGIWGTVCDDDFGQTEAIIVCRSLGFNGGATILKNHFGPGSGPIWLDQVFCTGNETSIADCGHWAWGEHNCNHTEDISISCSTGIGRPPVSTGVKGGKINPTNRPNIESFEEDDEGFSYNLERSSKILKEHKNCGIVKNVTDEFYASEERLQRVVHGSSAKRGHHPWQATIRTRGLSGKSTHWCGAVLITDRHLLTAAHCLAGYGKGAYFVRLGDHYANVAEASEIDVNIENWYIHESFRKGTHMNNDIALIVLKRPVRLNDYVQPICLPQKNVEYNPGKVCIISGWGSIQSGISTPANNLRAAEIPIISEDICKQPHVYGNSITEGMFCAGYLDENVDACDGDSGGPLVCTNNDLKTLYGIISWGQHCGYANKPGVYVKIAKYVGWIYEKLGIDTSAAGDIR